MEDADLTPLLELGPEDLDQDYATSLSMNGFFGTTLLISLRDYDADARVVMSLSRAEALRLATAITDYFVEPKSQ